MIMKSMKRTGPGSKTRTVMRKNEARKAPPPQMVRLIPGP